MDLQQNHESNQNPMKPVLYHQRQSFVLKSPHDSILNQNSAAMPVAPILLPPTQGHHQVQPWSSYYDVVPGTINNGSDSWTPYTSTAASSPALPAPTLVPDYHQIQHPSYQPHEHYHQYKLMEVMPMPGSVPNGQPSPGDPSFVFRPTTHPAGPAPMAFYVNVTQLPVEGFEEQSELLALQTGPQGQVSFYQGVDTHGMVQVAQMNERDPSNLTQENSKMESSKELSKEIPAWKKHCLFCRSNGEPSSVYRSHVLKNEKNKTVCPILMKYKCPVCEKTGEEAHTLKYCPRRHKNLEVASARRTNKIHLAKHVRSSTGKIHMLKY